MFDEVMAHLLDGTLAIMQLSVLIPMVVVWRRWRHFSAAVRSLSWYVYISALASLGGRYSHPYFLPNNYIFIFSFNCCKIILFGWVYYQILRAPRLRQLLIGLTAPVLAGTIWAFITDPILGMAVARVAQCALLAAFAIAYLDQYFHQDAIRPARKDPFWLLSIGQLIYSASTVTAFGLDYLTRTRYQQTFKYFFIVFAGFVFNWFLTLAFARAKRTDSFSPQPSLAPTGQLASS